jgi:hypothetical protein
VVIAPMRADYEQLGFGGDLLQGKLGPLTFELGTNDDFGEVDLDLGKAATQKVVFHPPPFGE